MGFARGVMGANKLRRPGIPGPRASRARCCEAAGFPGWRTRIPPPDPPDRSRSSLSFDALPIHFAHPTPGDTAPTSSDADLFRLLDEAIELEGADDPDAGTDVFDRPPAQVFANLLAEDPDARGDLDPETGLRRHPEHIGPFRVLSLLGEGGMGCVYLGEQEQPVQRRVAIKLIRANLVGAEARTRFEIERQALARLRHPTIATLFEAGTTDDGFPYFAMEWVDGLPLVEFCDQEQLDLEARLGLFIAICHGVEHAHRKGLLHRDLKPSNLLVARVDGVPRPKIIDFGIAKAVDGPLADGTALTRFGVGTPAYMSPEALGLDVGGGSDVGGGKTFDVDTRTDVYGLGMVLYQLLVGVLPFDAHSLSLGELIEKIGSTTLPTLGGRFRALSDEERQTIAGHRRETAAELRRQLRGDLEWITARALEPEKHRRYGSARELAEDLRRFLDREPVSVGPPSLGYRAGRFVGRHRGPVIAAGLVVILLVLGTLGTAVGTWRAQKEAARASAEIVKTREALLDAEETTRFLVELFEVSDPRQAGGHTTPVPEMLERGAEELGERLADQPIRRARLLHTLGTIYQHLGLEPEARQQVGTALELRRQYLGPDHPDTLESRELLGRLGDSTSVSDR